LDRFYLMNDLIGVLGIELNQGESGFTRELKPDKAVSRLDVLVQMKNITRVMLSFDLCQPCKV